MAPSFVSKKIYFLEHDHDLLVNLSLPDPLHDRQAGIILMGPAPQESLRFYWCQRQLSQRLAESGYHCWRFDYRGTGDSAGSLDDVRLDDWLNDARAVIKHAASSTAIKQITLIGLRLGAWLAAEASRILAVSRVLMIDPVCSGEQYVMQLDQLHKRMLFSNPDAPPFASEQSHFNQRLGFRYNQDLHHDLEQVQLDLSACQCQEIVAIISSCDPNLKEQVPDKARIISIKENLGWDDPWKLRLQTFAVELNNTVLDLMGAVS